MTAWQKTILILIVIATFGAVKFAFFHTPKEIVTPDEQAVEEVSQKPEESDENLPKTYVSIYFIGQNQNKDEVYKVVKRVYHGAQDGTKLKYSIENLLKGPTKNEQLKGIYSEIPQGTKLLSLEEKPDKVIINLSGNFQQGGGTDGLYKRLYQVIKTSNKNTTLDVYLYLDGKQADVIGGEGIMINQPLNSQSLDEG